MAISSVVRARIDPAIRKEAVEVLGKMGLTLSDAIRMMLTRVAHDRAIPFEVKVPNAETRAAMREARARLKSGEGFGRAEDILNELEGAGRSGQARQPSA